MLSRVYILSLVLGLLCLPGLAAPAMADTVEYNDTDLYINSAGHGSLLQDPRGVLNFNTVWNNNLGNASGNQVTINFTTGAYGNPDYVYGGYNDTATVSNNTVTILSGTLNNAYIYGGRSDSGAVTGNTVNISGGTVNHSIYGGRSNTGTATGNTVNISGGTVSGNIYGGLVDGNGNATGNTVSISGSQTLDLSGAVLYGGFSVSGDAITGNTLNVYRQITVQGLNNFANYNFYLPSTLAANQTMLIVSDGNGAGGAANITGSTVNVGIAGGSSPLQKGDKVVLIDSTAMGLTGAPVNSSANGQGMQGVTLRYTFDLLAQNDQLLATVASVGVNPQLKSLSEGRAAGLAFVNQGSDLIFGPGLRSMFAATSGTAQGGFMPFATGSAGWSRYNTGSHMDVSGASIMTGLAWRQPLNEVKAGSLLAGAFFEAGWGGYDSYNSFSNAASVKGDGNMNYYGGGVLGRYDFVPTGPGNFYVDASFRAGHASTDFSSGDLRDSTGRKADYDSGSVYYGMHAGLGYLWNITDKASLDFSTKYIWTHQNSDTVKVLGDPVRFDAVDSHRWRSGARFSYALGTDAGAVFSPYAGAYYDHEFDGKARSSTNGYGIASPSLSGGTGVGELGVSFKPVKNSGFSVDVGMQGYVGVREGVSGNLQMKYEF